MNASLDDNYYFALLLLDGDQLPTAEFEPTVPQNVAIAFIDDGQVGFSTMLFNAILSGVALTVAEVGFDWGTVFVHLPQAFDDTNEASIKQVLYTAEFEFYKMIFDRPHPGTVAAN